MSNPDPKAWAAPGKIMMIAGRTQTSPTVDRLDWAKLARWHCAAADDRGPEINKVVIQVDDLVERLRTHFEAEELL